MMMTGVLSFLQVMIEYNMKWVEMEIASSTGTGTWISYFTATQPIRFHLALIIRISWIPWRVWSARWVNSVFNKDARSALQCDLSQSLHLGLCLSVSLSPDFSSDICWTQPQHEVSCYKRESARPNRARRNPPSTAAADVTSFLDADRNSRTAPK